MQFRFVHRFGHAQLAQLCLCDRRPVRSHRLLGEVSLLRPLLVELIQHAWWSLSLGCLESPDLGRVNLKLAVSLVHLKGAPASRSLDAFLALADRIHFAAEWSG